MLNRIKSPAKVARLPMPVKLAKVSNKSKRVVKSNKLSYKKPQIPVPLKKLAKL